MLKLNVIKKRNLIHFIKLLKYKRKLLVEHVQEINFFEEALLNNLVAG